MRLIPPTVNSLYLNLPRQVTQSLCGPSLLVHLFLSRCSTRSLSFHTPLRSSRMGPPLADSEIAKEEEHCSRMKGARGNNQEGEIPKSLESSRYFQKMAPITDNNVNGAGLPFLTVPLVGPLYGEPNRTLWVWTGLDPTETMTHSVAQEQHRKGVTAGSDDIPTHSRTCFQTPLGWAPRSPDLGCSAYMLYNCVITLGPRSNINKHRKLFPCHRFQEKYMLFF